MDRVKERSWLSILKRSIAISVMLLLLLSSDMNFTPVDACSATVTTPTTVCKDPSTLFVDTNGASSSLDKTGTQEAGTTVVATCSGDDTMFLVTFDDATAGREDEDPTPGNKEEFLTLICNSSGLWRTTTVDDQALSGSQVTKSGTVTNDASIECTPYVNEG